MSAYSLYQERYAAERKIEEIEDKKRQTSQDAKIVSRLRDRINTITKLVKTVYK